MKAVLISTFERSNECITFPSKLFVDDSDSSCYRVQACKLRYRVPGKRTSPHSGSGFLNRLRMNNSRRQSDQEMCRTQESRIGEIGCPSHLLKKAYYDISG
ncbi:hypothetical protein BES34_021780 [Leptospira inadai serovar Lyme]|uniref:Lipoprotein n=1 Tax=Leptospira inadai serovar Lyme TaxID=293084 RepID=A0ABX4YCI0_9LEPT|nr:hypothetical protein BES34_021780 [Leptospira inadai serovar Lyme]